jgi:PAS domain S-box-containing protein
MRFRRRSESSDKQSLANEYYGILRAVIEGTTDAIFVKDLEGRYLLVNSACARFLGKSAEEIVGRLDIDLYQAESARQFLEDDRKVIQTGETQVFEGTASGTVGDRAYRVTKGIFRDEQGRKVGVFGISHDITDRTRAEEERIKRAIEQAAREESETSLRAKDELLKALGASEERYRSLTENANDIIYSHDLQGNYLTVNRAGEKITGYTRDEILNGMSVAQIVAPEHLELAREMLELKLRDPSSTVYEVDIVTKDRRHLTVEVSTRIAYRDGEPYAVEGIARDITERKRAEEEREQSFKREQRAREEAERANRLKDEFLATLSHELRTPLTSIIGWVNLVRSGQITGEAATEALETVERNARAQAGLINDLLDVSRIVTGKLRLNITPLALRSVIEAAIASMRPAAEAKEISILTEIELEQTLMLGDPDRLQQIVWNLLSNAVKFTPDGGQIKIRAACSGSRAIIEVIDTGVGIEPEFLPYVFDRFRQADQSTTRMHGGLGLGLAIVRHLVDLHGGSAQVNSAGAGKGSTFSISMPLHGVSPSQEPEVKQELEYRASLTGNEELWLDGLRVLVVDDDDDAREMMGMVLTKRGAAVALAASAQVALETLRKDKFDVLISDIGMPDEDGYSLIKKIRALPPAEGGEIPAAALTAYARDEDRVKALLAGFQIHVPKPVSLAELTAVAARLGEKRGS